MRCLARVGLALCGLALTTPTSIWADPPASPNTLELTNPADLPNTSKPKPNKRTRGKAKVSQAPTHQHQKDWLGREIVCPTCQYNRLRAQGINVPPPPGLATPGQAPAQGAGGPGVAVVVQSAPGVPLTPGQQVTPEMQAFLNQIPTQPGQIIIVNPNDIPGHAVVGDSSAPGLAVVGEAAPGSEPAPVGPATQRQGFRLARRSAPSAPTDGSVMPSSVTSASTPMAVGSSGNPHVFSHLFGIAAFGRDIRDGIAAREQKKRDKHAAISYDAPNEKVTELPASMVYDH